MRRDKELSQKISVLYSFISTLKLKQCDQCYSQQQDHSQTEYNLFNMEKKRRESYRYKLPVPLGKEGELESKDGNRWKGLEEEHTIDELLAIPVFVNYFERYNMSSLYTA